MKTLIIAGTYRNGGKLIETIGKDTPMSRTLMKWKARQLRSTTHKLGELIPVKAN